MNRNGMGPSNAGPLTGRRLGSCKGQLRKSLSESSDSVQDGQTGGQRVMGPGMKHHRGRGMRQKMGYRAGLEKRDGTDETLMISLMERINTLESEIRELKEGQL